MKQHKYYQVFYTESNFDRMKRLRKRRKFIMDILLNLAAVAIIVLGIAAIVITT